MKKILFLLFQIFSQAQTIVTPIAIDATTGQQKIFNYGSDIDISSKPNPAKGISMFEDWLNTSPSGLLGWSTATSGAGSAATIDPTLVDSIHLGILRLNAGTNAAGRSVLYLGTDIVKMGGGLTDFEVLLRLEALSSGTQEYVVRVGFGNDINANDYSEGIYFEYDRTASTSWRICTATTPITTTNRTKTTTAVTVNAGEWVKISATINTDATAIAYYINGTLVGAISTNIPKGKLVSPIGKIVKTVGNNSRSLYIDYATSSIIYNTSK